MNSDIKTYFDLYTHIKNQLDSNSFENSSNEAFIILEIATKLSKTSILSFFHSEVEDTAIYDAVIDILAIRLSHYPLQYISKEWAFHCVDLKISDKVFIPRMETEKMVDTIINSIPRTQNTLKGLEIGTGTGAISIALLSSVFNLSMYACDINPHAIKSAKINSIINNVSNRFFLFGSDLYSAISQNAKFDFIVSNPPYIDFDKKNIMSKETQFEPVEALFCGNHGKLIPEIIITNSPYLLNKNGVMLIEVASYNIEYLSSIAQSIGYSVQVLKDSNNITRFLFCKK